jgi:hypothetical protein
MGISLFRDDMFNLLDCLYGEADPKRSTSCLKYERWFKTMAGCRLNIVIQVNQIRHNVNGVRDGPMSTEFFSD